MDLTKINRKRKFEGCERSLPKVKLCGSRQKRAWQQQCSEICNIPSIGYEQTKARKGSSLEWYIPFIGIALCGACTSRRCIGVSDGERSAATFTYIC